MRAALWVQSTLAAQQNRLFYWSPICLAMGIGIYFSLSSEPPVAVYFLCGAGIAILFALRWITRTGQPVMVGVMLVLIGFCLAGGRTHIVAEPVLKWRYYGLVEGRVVHIDRSASGALRLTLDRVTMDPLGPSSTPTLVRVSLHSKENTVFPKPGQTILTTAFLVPPAGAVEPGGFDFQRHSWFLGVGAHGYTRKPLTLVSETQEIGFFPKLRYDLSAKIQAALPGISGGFAAAILTGDRTGLSLEAIENLRIANLAHLLAISGLHMGLVAGLFYGWGRLFMAAIPYIALRYPCKKISAAIALIMAAFYLGLSGASVATQRAFIMAAVALIAVILDRRALSLRSVALAAWGVLLLRPESLFNPGFQMSFSATTMLVVAFSALQKHRYLLGPAWLAPVTTVLFTSAVAGAATAPIAAAYFNQIAAYGLIANLLSVPMMALIIMPVGILALFLLPFGAENATFWIMGQAIEWVLWVAKTVAALPNARSMIVQPPPYVLPLIAVGLLMVILWHGRGRWLGFVPAFVGVLFWYNAERPRILVSQSGGLVGIMTTQGRALSAVRGDGFTARVWLENDGDLATQEQAAARWPEALFTDVIAVKGKANVAKTRDCPSKALLILSHPPVHPLPCTVLDPETLSETGSVSAHYDGQSWLITGARSDRLWSGFTP